MQMDLTMIDQLHVRTENLEENGGIFSDSEAPTLPFLVGITEQTDCS